MVDWTRKGLRNRGCASAGRHRRMLAILPALDAAFKAREPLRDVAQPPLNGPQSSIQAGNLAPEEPADREHGKSVDQHLHSSKRIRR